MTGTTTEPEQPGPPPPPITSSDGTRELGPRPETEATDAAEDVAVEPADESDEVESDEAPAPRRRRVLHRRRTGRLRTVTVALVAIGVALAVPLLGLLAARTIANSREGRAVVVDVPLSRLPATPAALLVGLDDAGRPASLTLLSVAADGHGGTAIVLPLSTAAFLDGPATASRLDQAWDRGGLEAQTQGVESVLGISTTTSEAVDAVGLATLFEPYAPVGVTLESAVLDTRPDGSVEEVFPAGDVTLSASQMAELVLARVDGESELARLPRQEALWNAILSRPEAAPGATTTAAAAGGAPTDLAGFLTRLTDGPTGVHVLRVTPSFDPSNPTAPEVLQADVPYLRLLVASVMPGAVSPSNGNISFRIVNPLGDPNLTYRAVGRLAAVQANIVLVTETAGPVPAHTEVMWHSAAGEVQAGAFAPVIGGAAPTASPERIDGIDATVVLGQDFLGFLEQEDAKVAATSSTTSTSTTVAPTTTSKKGKG